MPHLPILFLVKDHDLLRYLGPLDTHLALIMVDLSIHLPVCARWEALVVIVTHSFQFKRFYATDVLECPLLPHDWQFDVLTALARFLVLYFN